jgi:hypothetical protein
MPSCAPTGEPNSQCGVPDYRSAGASVHTDQQQWSLSRRVWSQVVAAAQRVPANVVAVWSQSGDPTAGGDPVTGLWTIREFTRGSITESDTPTG